MIDFEVQSQIIIISIKGGGKTTDLTLRANCL